MSPGGYGGRTSCQDVAFSHVPDLIERHGRRAAADEVSYLRPVAVAELRFTDPEGQASAEVLVRDLDLCLDARVWQGGPVDGLACAWVVGNKETEKRISRATESSTVIRGPPLCVDAVLVMIRNRLTRIIETDLN